MAEPNPLIIDDDKSEKDPIEISPEKMDDEEPGPIHDIELTPMRKSFLLIHYLIPR
jgi:hypothetical protein